MGRTVWVNKNQSFGSETGPGQQNADCLSAGDRALISNSTIVAIRGTVVISAPDPVPSGSWSIGLALYIADIAQSVFPNPLTEATEASYLWHRMEFLRGNVANTMGYHKTIELNVKAKRKFRENNKTMWFLNRHDESGTAPLLDIRFFLRILIYVP